MYIIGMRELYPDDFYTCDGKIYILDELSSRLRAESRRQKRLRFLSLFFYLIYLPVFIPLFYGAAVHDIWWSIPIIILSIYLVVLVLIQTIETISFKKNIEQIREEFKEEA